MRRARDRRVGGVAAAAATLVLVLVAAVVSSPAWPHPAVEHDPTAARDLFALVAAGEGATYLVEFSATRVLPSGDARTERVVEAQRPPRRVVLGGTTATVDVGGRRTRCTATDAGVQCLPEPLPAESLPAAEVYRVAIEREVYAVRRLPTRRVAGEDAQCFELWAVRGVLPDLGLVAERCLAADGVPLADRAATATVDDRRTATSVRRDVSTDDLAALLERLTADSVPAAAS